MSKKLDDVVIASALILFKDPLYAPIGVLNAAVITTSSSFLVIANTT